MIVHRFGRAVLGSALIALALGCAGSRPADLGVQDGRLGPCPDSPNCVLSDATDEGHAIDGFRYAGSADAAWQAAVSAVAALPRTEIITQQDAYLHAESTTALMRYVDDLELQLRETDEIIAVRSASRVGHSDMGANRERVEALRSSLAAAGVLK